MSLIDAGLNRSRTVIASLVLLLIAGGFAFNSIPKEAEPDVNIPIIYVTLNHQGISPEDSERLLVRPMEAEMRAIEGIKEIRSTAYQGGGNVLMEFEAGFNVDRALDDVREKVDLVKPRRADGQRGQSQPVPDLRGHPVGQRARTHADASVARIAGRHRGRAGSARGQDRRRPRRAGRNCRRSGIDRKLRPRRRHGDRAVEPLQPVDRRRRAGHRPGPVRD
jgi:hypothetical protein